MIRGEYVIKFRKGPDEDEEELIIPNLITHLGIETILEKLFRDDGSTVLGNLLYIGMCDEVVEKTTLMANVTTEPTATGGYARQSISRVASAWTIGTIGTEGYRYAISNAVTFTATGANFSRAFTRLFLATALTGGTLISVSAALPNAFLLLTGTSIDVQYRFFLD